MKDKYILTEGNILRQLIFVSLPVMGTSLVQMAYNLTDLFWLGRVGDEAVSSAGFGGYFIWLAAALVLLVRIGTEVRVSQRTGAGSHAEAREYAKTGVQLITIFSFIYGAIMFASSEILLSFFNIDSVGSF